MLFEVINCMLVLLGKFLYCKILFFIIIKIKNVFILKSLWRFLYKFCIKFILEIYGRIKFFIFLEKGIFVWGS